MPERRTRRQKNSSIPYILLNILISALTTLTVLFIWNKVQESRHPADTVFNYQNDLAQSIPLSTKISTTDEPAPLPALDQTVIEINNVYGIGDLENEEVVLKRVGEDELWLTGWTISDGDKNVYTFKELVVNRGGEVQLFTSAGHDGVNALFWGLQSAVWKSGKTVFLYDYQGNLRAKYLIP